MAATAAGGAVPAHGGGGGGRVDDDVIEPASWPPTKRTIPPVVDVDVLIGLLNAGGDCHVRLPVSVKEAKKHDSISNLLAQCLTDVYPPLRGVTAGEAPVLSVAPASGAGRAGGAGGAGSGDADGGGGSDGTGARFSAASLEYRFKVNFPDGATQAFVDIWLPPFSPTVEVPLCFRPSSKQKLKAKLRSGAHAAPVNAEELVKRMRVMRHAELHFDVELKLERPVDVVEYGTRTSTCSAAFGSAWAFLGDENEFVEAKALSDWPWQPATAVGTWVRDQIVTHVKDYAGPLLAASIAAGRAHLLFGVHDHGLTALGVPVDDPERLSAEIRSALESLFPRVRGKATVRLVEVHDPVMEAAIAAAGKAGEDRGDGGGGGAAVAASDSCALMPIELGKVKPAREALRCRLVRVGDIADGDGDHDSSDDDDDDDDEDDDDEDDHDTDSDGDPQASSLRVCLDPASAARVLDAVRKAMKGKNEAERSKHELEPLSRLTEKVVNYVVHVELELDVHAVFSTLFWRQRAVRAFVANAKRRTLTELTPFEFHQRVLAAALPPRAIVGRALCNRETAALVVTQHDGIHCPAAAAVVLLRDGIRMDDRAEPFSTADRAAQAALEKCHRRGRVLVRVLLVVDPSADADPALKQLWRKLMQSRYVLQPPVVVAVEGVQGNDVIAAHVAAMEPGERVVDTALFESVDAVVHAFSAPSPLSVRRVADAEVPGFIVIGEARRAPAAYDGDPKLFWQFLCGRIDVASRDDVLRLCVACVERGQASELVEIVDGLLRLGGCRRVNICSLFGATGATVLLAQLCAEKRGMWVGPEESEPTLRVEEWASKIADLALSMRFSVICICDKDARRERNLAALTKKLEASPIAVVVVYLRRFSPPTEQVPGSWIIVDPRLNAEERREIVDVYNGAATKARLVKPPFVDAATLNEGEGDAFLYAFPLVAAAHTRADNTGADDSDMSVIRMVRRVLDATFCGGDDAVRLVKAIAAATILVPHQPVNLGAVRGPSAVTLPPRAHRILHIRRRGADEYWQFRHPLLALHVAQALAPKHTLFSAAYDADSGTTSLNFKTRDSYKLVLEWFFDNVLRQRAAQVVACMQQILPMRWSSVPAWMGLGRRQGFDAEVDAVLTRLHKTLEAIRIDDDQSVDVRNEATKSRVQLCALTARHLRNQGSYDRAIEIAEQAVEIAHGTGSAHLAKHVLLNAQGFVVGTKAEPLKEAERILAGYSDLRKATKESSVKQTIDNAAASAIRAWSTKEWMRGETLEGNLKRLVAQFGAPSGAGGEGESKSGGSGRDKHGRAASSGPGPLRDTTLGGAGGGGGAGGAGGAAAPARPRVREDNGGDARPSGVVPRRSTPAPSSPLAWQLLVSLLGLEEEEEDGGAAAAAPMRFGQFTALASPPGSPPKS